MIPITKIVQKIVLAGILLLIAIYIWAYINLLIVLYNMATLPD